MAVLFIFMRESLSSDLKNLCKLKLRLVLFKKILDKKQIVMTNVFTITGKRIVKYKFADYQKS